MAEDTIFCSETPAGPAAAHPTLSLLVPSGTNTFVTPKRPHNENVVYPGLFSLSKDPPGVLRTAKDLTPYNNLGTPTVKADNILPGSRRSLTTKAQTNVSEGIQQKGPSPASETSRPSLKRTWRPEPDKDDDRSPSQKKYKHQGEDRNKVEDPNDVAAPGIYIGWHIREPRLPILAKLRSGRMSGLHPLHIYAEQDAKIPKDVVLRWSQLVREKAAVLLHDVQLDPELFPDLAINKVALDAHEKIRVIKEYMISPNPKIKPNQKAPKSLKLSLKLVTKATTTPKERRQLLASNTPSTKTTGTPTQRFKKQSGPKLVVAHSIDDPNVHVLAHLNTSNFVNFHVSRSDADNSPVLFSFNRWIKPESFNFEPEFRKNNIDESKNYIKAKLLEMSKALQTESEPSKLDEHVSDLPDMAAKPKTPATLTSSTTSATPITTNTAARNKSTALPEIPMYNDKDITINPTRKQEIEKNIHAGVRQILEAHTSYATITQSELDKAYADVKSQKVNLNQLSKNCSYQVDELTRLRTGIAVLEEANSQHDAAIAQRDDKIHNPRGDITRNLTVIQQLDDKVSILEEEKMQKLATIEQQSGNVRSLEERINMLELEVEKAREVTSPSSGMVHPHDVLKLLETQRKILDMEILPNELAKIKKQHEQALARLEVQNEDQQEHAELFAEEETQPSPLSASPAISIPDGTPLSDLFAKVNLSDERFNTVPAIVPGSAYPRVMRNAGMKAAKTIHQVTIEDKTYSERLYYQAVKFDVLGEKQDCEIKLGGKVFERYKDAADGKETLVSKVELSRVKLFKSDLFVEWAIRKEIDEKDMY